MFRFVLAVTLVSTLALTGCEAPVPDARDYAAEVAALAEEALQRTVADSPYLQVRDGGLIRELPEFTPERAADDIAFARSMLARLDAIPVDGLEHEDALSVAMLRWDSQLALELEPCYWLSFPYSPYMLGFELNFLHGQLPMHPFTDPQAHPAGYLKVLHEYADLIEQLGTHLRGQMERGIYLSKHALPGVIGTFESYRQIVERVMRVSPDRLASLSKEQRAALTQGVEEALVGRALPAFDGLLATLRSDPYQAAAGDAVGLAQYEGGEACYRTLVKLHTTMEVTPEELHALGKQRVAELEAEMAEIRDELGFTGTKEAFHHKLRTDPQFFATSPEEVEARFEAYIARIEPKIGDYFRTLPKAPYGVERLDPAVEATMTFGFYQPPTPDEPVGRYNYNGSRLDQRPQIWAGPLIYHELVPGHHFHLALQSENESLPRFRREYVSASAYNEGWANYGALLAGEMGLLDDPYDRYGAALFDIFSSVRLVVDTGMNLFGWSLEEGRAYMREHTFQSDTEIATETLRYSTDLFGQALAYKGGVEKLVELREAARERAGDAFDIRDFHDAVLGSGAMPLAILEEHLEWYFAPPNDD